MANVFDVAKYILEKKGPMSTVKLQKLVYYSQAWTLVWDDVPLFEEEFRAWDNGPMCEELFYKTQGKFSVSAEEETGGLNNLSANEKDSIDRVIEYYGNHNSQWLSQLTKMEFPWKNAYSNGISAEGKPIITKESMAIYYGGL